MKKVLAVFLFAVGVGASLTAAATSCEYRCGVAYRICLKNAGGNVDAQGACWEAYDNCNQSCG
ncbi:hypothetical protein [Pseudoduganella violaceinigra]|uniref:hypothetical protein n=1 Tax=Pseudoduganella violaceinigra TaxID=246602 RepID=UPI0003FB1D1E|nr:hypothetical protein [Pseudoduganella violaceinigra]